jgi:DNA-binding NarL/FixJ family response regulator
VIRVAILEDHPLYRQGLIQMIELADECELIGAAGSADEMDQIGYGECDVAILDLHLPDCSGPEAVLRVKEHAKAILVVSASEDRVSVLEAIGAGASGYLPKSADAQEIARAIHIIAGGGTYISPVLASYLLAARREHESDGSFVLTSRESEILSLVAEGETDSDIADRLFISVRTVRSHLDRIRDKTGRRRRADLTRLAYEQGVVGEGT